MNKIVLNFGLLVFFISLIFYSQKDLPIHDIIIRSLLIFVMITIAATIVAILFIKAANKSLLKGFGSKRDDEDYDLGPDDGDEETGSLIDDNLAQELEIENELEKDIAGSTNEQ